MSVAALPEDAFAGLIDDVLGRQDGTLEGWDRAYEHLILPIPEYGGLLFHRDDGTSGCPGCGSVFSTLRRPRLNECVVCDYDWVVKAAVEAVRSRMTARRNEHKDVGRNDPCYCGSGKKRKKCHP